MNPDYLVIWNPTQVQLSRLAALTDHLRGVGHLGSAGHHLVWGDSGQTAPAVTIEPPNPEAQSIIDAWDWSPESDATARRSASKAKAKAAFADTLDPIATAARNADRALFRSLKQTREKLNEVIAWINANGGAITPLTNRTFAQAMQGAAALVDAETDPTGG